MTLVAGEADGLADGDAEGEEPPELGDGLGVPPPELGDPLAGVFCAELAWPVPDPEAVPVELPAVEPDPVADPDAEAPDLAVPVCVTGAIISFSLFAKISIWALPPL